MEVNHVTYTGKVEAMYDALREFVAFLNANSQLLHFLFFGTFFAALTWATLKKRFPGPAGKLVSVSFGLALSAPLAFMIDRWQLDFLGIGTVPQFVLAFLLVILSLFTLKRLALDSLTASAVGLLAVGMFAAQIAWVENWLPGIDPRMLMSVAGMLLAIRLLYPIFSARPPPDATAYTTRELERSRAMAAAEMSRMRPQMAWAYERSAGLSQRLSRLLRELKRSEPRGQPDRRVDDALAGIATLETELRDRLGKIQSELDGLRRRDEKTCGVLARTISRVNRRAWPSLSRGFDRLWFRRKQEGHMERRVVSAADQVRRVERCLDKARGHLRKGNPKRAQQWLMIAEKRQQVLVRSLKNAAKLEANLVRMTGERGGAEPRT